jgi:hypothetical protein
MMSTPTCNADGVFALEDRAPPAACSSKEIKSQVMKVIVYVLGEKREISVP